LRVPGNKSESSLWIVPSGLNEIWAGEYQDATSISREPIPVIESERVRLEESATRKERVIPSESTALLERVVYSKSTDGVERIGYLRESAR
jgi:hypothetical protein